MTTSNDAKLVEMERMMRTAPEPGGLAGVSMGEDVGVTGTSVTSAGYVTMWNTDMRAAQNVLHMTQLGIHNAHV